MRSVGGGRLRGELEKSGSQAGFLLPDGEIASFGHHMTDAARIGSVLQKFALFISPNELAISKQILLGSENWIENFFLITFSRQLEITAKTRRTRQILKEKNFPEMASPNCLRTFSFPNQSNRTHCAFCREKSVYQIIFQIKVELGLTSNQLTGMI